jgi:hypothetical protein
MFCEIFLVEPIAVSMTIGSGEERKASLGLSYNNFNSLQQQEARPRKQHGQHKMVNFSRPAIAATASLIIVSSIGIVTQTQNEIPGDKVPVS